MNNQHPWSFKKLKSWRPFWSYQLNRTANSAFLAILVVNRLNWQCCLNSWQLQNTPQDCEFFQWPWVLIIHLSLFSLRPMPPNIFDIISFSQASLAWLMYQRPDFAHKSIRLHSSISENTKNSFLPGHLQAKSLDIQN